MPKYTATITKTKDTRQVGDYRPTTIDERRAAANFLLLQTSPNVVHWRKGLIGGKTEVVSHKVLKGIQAIHSN